MGVVVASLLPMRAIPFRAVFVMGLGEGQFPEEGMELGLDLRRAERRPGDVAPEERDRYAFLETLVSTRERLFLSYVARDEHTGEPHVPSSVVTELLEAAGGAHHLRPPARRHELFVEGEARAAWLEELAAAGLGHPFAHAAMASALGGAVAESAARARGDVERTHFREIEIASEAWASLAPDDPRRVELALPPLGRAALDAERSVRLDTLRAFLRCPLQGRARHWLRDVEDDDALLVVEEPLDAEGAVLAGLARRAFVAALEGGLGAPELGGRGTPMRALDHAVRHAVEEARSRGRVPVGALGHDVAADVLARASRWLTALREARPGAALARAVRLGRVAADASPGERHVEVRAALALEACSPPAGATAAHREAAAARTVVVEGRTRALLRADASAPPGDLVLVLGDAAAGEGERARAARGVAAFEAYLDHAVLAASGQERLARRALFLAGSVAYETALPGLARAQASRWLRGLTDEIRAVEAPSWFLPAEAVVLEAETLRRGDPKLAEKLGKSIERVRTKLEGGSSRHGALRAADVVTREPPEPRELLAILARRHGPVLAGVRPPARSGAGADAAEGLLR
jgi:exodeoxyribonuclease V gamma subunit